MPSAYLQWRFHSGERVVARGPLVLIFFLNMHMHTHTHTHTGINLVHVYHSFHEQQREHRSTVFSTSFRKSFFAWRFT